MDSAVQSALLLEPVEAIDVAVDRRIHPRVRGRQVRVCLADAETHAKWAEAWVLDRSSGGLALAVREPVAVGTQLCVRAEGLPVPRWVLIEVRHVRPWEEGWVLGCQFIWPPSWEAMLQFC